MLTRTFLTQTIERALKTFAQVMLALLTGDGFNLLTINWKMVLSVAGFAALYSVVSSVASIRLGKDDGPSAV